MLTLESGRPLLNTAHPLLNNITRLWLPPINPSAFGGPYVPSFGIRGAPAKLVGMPTWRSTPYGPAIATDNLKYVDLEPLSWFTGTYAVAYAYRYDASGSQETGILISDGTNGHSFRHKAGTLELLKSHVISILSANVGQPNRDTLHTAIVTVGWSAAAQVSLYFDGRLVGTTVTSQGMATGTTTTALGYDFNATTSEFGRHSILAAAHWSPRVLTGHDAFLWDQIARQRFRPLFIQRLFLVDGLTHIPDALATATRGFGFGASFFNPDAFDRTSQGLGLGATEAGLAELPGSTSQGLGLGASAGNVEAFDGTSQGFGLGATDAALADDLATSIQGLALGATAGNPDSFDNTSQGIGLGSTPTETLEGVGFTTQGFGLGALGSLGFLSDGTTQGLGFGSMLSDVIENDAESVQGFALGENTFLPDTFVRATFGMGFGSAPGEDQVAVAGVGLGALFVLDAVFSIATAGLGLGSRFFSDSGDLANARYRR
jgi:hypothetical protein